MKQPVLFLLIFCGIISGKFIAQAQGIAVNTSGAAANSSAMLDVASSNRGMLVPRMLSSQRTAISSPATGLLVYQTDAPAGFYQYNGTGWLSLIADSTAAGGDLAGKYPVPTIANSATAGAHAVTAINASSSVINPANLGTGTASSSTVLHGDGTWGTVSGGSSASRYLIPLGSGSSQLRLTTTSTGASDSINLVGLGTAGNQLININAGAYLDPSFTFPGVAVPVPDSGTVTSFSFFFRIAPSTPTFLMFTGTYTFEAKLYYCAPPSSNLIGSEQFFPVTGASVSINMTTATGGIAISGETLYGSASGLSFLLVPGSRLMIYVDYNVNTTPSSVQPLSGYVTASVGMR